MITEHQDSREPFLCEEETVQALSQAAQAGCTMAEAAAYIRMLQSIVDNAEQCQLRKYQDQYLVPKSLIEEAWEMLVEKVL
jgi:hypothetical protein